MSKILSAVTALLLVWLSLAAAQTQKKAVPVAKKATPTASKKAAPTTSKKGATTASRGKKPAAKRPSVTWRNRQTVPSSDRYREIQTALVSRGYLGAEEANGAWNQASIEALKKFQAEQNLETSGKINSLSLIALGLGPKRDAAPVLPPPVQ